MNPLRVGIIGVGNMGGLLLKVLRDGTIAGATVTAVVCRPERAAALAGDLDATITRFDDADALFSSGRCDAVVIATPHTFHPAQTIAALRAGLHVFCEKPAGICASEARAMAAAARESGKVYTLHFNRRTAPLWQKIRELVRDGTLGEWHRFNWTSTAWMRSQAYFDANPWRGTWAGEGGGMLVNQLPHTLDHWQWIFGLPERVWATCGFGRYHELEVEDEVCAVAEYASGAKGVFIANTGEAPGVERLELVGDRATIIAEKNALSITRLKTPASEWIRTAGPGFGQPEAETEVLELDGAGDYAAGILRDWVARIHDGGPLLAPGEEGVASLELANAILLSSWRSEWISLPMNEMEFEKLLQLKRQDSRFREPPRREAK